ncbi:MAG: acyl-CoA dehydrogenase [bacterium]
MAEQFYSKRNLKFLLYEVLDVERLSTSPYFSDHNREGYDMILDAAEQLATELLYPHLTAMDREQPRLVEGQIRVHPVVKKIMQEFGDGGWITAPFPYEEGGQQLPSVIHYATGFVFGAANYSASVYPGLTTGAANLIRTFGTEELKMMFISKMARGAWQGTMALTEPQAGSSLAEIESSAEPTTDGIYKIKGQKVFISAGDHDGVENIVHLTLARIKGAPAGTKGISLFAVPRKRLDGSGELVPNDVTTASIYHKMGYTGAPIAHLLFGEDDDCHGYLVGEPHKGLKHMFQMMNESRIAVGMSATSIASAAYYASLKYAKERTQGRLISDKDLSKPQVEIIKHADVKRMLLFQKAIVEGCLSLLLQCSLYADLARVAREAGNLEESERADLLLELLTPVAKTYPSEMGCSSTSAALQCLGGYGYTKDYVLEQFYREARIHPIHEGTTGIHGLDLLGRKVLMQDGKAFKLFWAEVSKTIKTAQALPALRGHAGKLERALQKLQKTTLHLAAMAKKGEVTPFLADATLYLEFFGIVALAWQWVLQGIQAEKALSVNAAGETLIFYQSKLHTLTYFYEYELPKIEALATRLTSPARVTLEMSDEHFV